MERDHSMRPPVSGAPAASRTVYPSLRGGTYHLYPSCRRSEKGRMQIQGPPPEEVRCTTTPIPGAGAGRRGTGERKRLCKQCVRREAASMFERHVYTLPATLCRPDHPHAWWCRGCGTFTAVDQFQHCRACVPPFRIALRTLLRRHLDADRALDGIARPWDGERTYHLDVCVAALSSSSRPWTGRPGSTVEVLARGGGARRQGASVDDAAQDPAGR
jgi:hypothetical protein